jgi:hypothetical protein
MVHQCARIARNAPIADTLDATSRQTNSRRWEIALEVGTMPEYEVLRLRSEVALLRIQLGRAHARSMTHLDAEKLITDLYADNDAYREALEEIQKHSVCCDARETATKALKSVLGKSAELAESQDLCGQKPESVGRG